MSKIVRSIDTLFPAGAHASPSAPTPLGPTGVHGKIHIRFGARRAEGTYLGLYRPWVETATCERVEREDGPVCMSRQEALDRARADAASTVGLYAGDWEITVEGPQS